MGRWEGQSDEGIGRKERTKNRMNGKGMGEERKMMGTQSCTETDKGMGRNREMGRQN